MGHPWKPYVVRKGDHLERLAFRFGTDADTLWSHEKNRAVAAIRKDRNTLCAGDVLFVPSDPPPGLTLTSQSANRYSAHVPSAHVEIHIDARTRSIAGKAFVVRGDFGDEPVKGVVSNKGVVAFDVPMLAEHLELLIPEADIAIPLHLGALDPIGEPSGVLQRLQNLGHVPRVLDVHPDRVAWGLKTFREAAGITVTGPVDDETRRALVRAHRG